MVLGELILRPIPPEVARRVEVYARALGDRRPVRPRRPPLRPGRVRAGLARPAPQRLRRALGAGPQGPAEDQRQARGPAGGGRRGSGARRAVDELRRPGARHARARRLGHVPDPGLRAAGLDRRRLGLPRPARLRARPRRLRHQPRRGARGVRPHRSSRPGPEGLRLAGDADRAVRDGLRRRRRLLLRRPARAPPRQPPRCTSASPTPCDAGATPVRPARRRPARHRLPRPRRPARSPTSAPSSASTRRASAAVAAGSPGAFDPAGMSRIQQEYAASLDRGVVSR